MTNPAVLHSAYCAKCGCDQLFDKWGKCMQCNTRFREVKPDIKVRRCRVKHHRKSIKDTGSVGGDAGPLFAQGMGNG